MTREQLDKIIEEAPEAFASLLGDLQPKIIEEAPEAFASLLGDLQPKIIEAAKATLEESQDSESGKAVVKVGLSLAIDLCTSPVSWHVEASVGVRHKVKSEAHVADTSPELPGLEKKGGGR